MSEPVAKHWRIHQRQHPDLLQHICKLRGFSSDELAPNYLTHLHDPFLLPDMSRACAIIDEAAKKKWHVTIFGDYDADGTPAAALLSIALTKIGLPHEVVLPTRLSGYGLRPDQVRQIARKSQVLITVDTGISSVQEVSVAKELGMKVIILDHHLPPAVLPAADAVVDPHRVDSEYPFPHLCGCALAYKFVVALGKTFPDLNERFTKWLLDLVAVSTVADMMPLLGENRALVHYGLIVLRQNRRPGFAALLAKAGVESSQLSAYSLGYIIGPRLNAAGRLGDNAPAYELLVANQESSLPLATVIETANTKRQELVASVMDEARQILFQDNDRDDYIYLLAKHDWPAGIVGLVAGKLAAEHARPVLVATFENETARGSARSIEHYPIVTALARQSELLTSFGGHTAAAGFSLKTADWPKFVKKLKADARQHLVAESLRRTYTVDAELESGDVNRRTVDSLSRLQPHGLGNSRPLFLVRDVALKDLRRIGREGQHLKTRVVSKQHDIDAVAFGLADQLISTRETHDLIGYLELNRWRNQETLQFQIVDYKPAGAKVEWITNG